MSADLLDRLVEAALRTITKHADELNALDEAIGDGDHGVNLARGLRAVARGRRALADLPWPLAFERIGATLRAEVGGRSGPLYEAFFAGLADHAPDAQSLTLEAAAGMIDAGVAAIEREGGAKRGDKTMVDVLRPVADVLKGHVAAGRADDVGARLMAAAAHGLHATTRMEARRGLAADLGAASVNHMDPGACSAAFIVGALVSALSDSPAT